MEPLKQYLWEAVPGAKNAEEATRVVFSLTNEDTGSEPAVDAIEAFRQMGRAYGEIFSLVRDAVEAFGKGLSEAFRKADSTTQRDFEVTV